MEAWDILGDVVLLLAAAAVVGMLFERLGASSIIGCMIAGMLMGPGVLGWVASEASLATWPQALPAIAAQSHPPPAPP